MVFTASYNAVGIGRSVEANTLFHPSAAGQIYWDLR
jgi:hypothetical protein